MNPRFTATKEEIRYRPRNLAARGRAHVSKTAHYDHPEHDPLNQPVVAFGLCRETSSTGGRTAR
jgi:hypothetical protein